MARTKTSTRDDTTTLTTSWRNRHLENIYLCFFMLDTTQCLTIILQIVHTIITLTGFKIIRPPQQYDLLYLDERY